MDDPMRELRELGAAAIYEAQGRKNALAPGIRALWTPLVLAGPAFTVESVPGDNLALHQAVAEAPAGVVLVASTSNSALPLFGDLLASIAMGKGILGLITDSAVRDSDRVRRLNFPVFCRGTSLFGPSKERWGKLRGRIELDGVSIADGDVVLADGDGVVVVPERDLDQIIARAREVREREREIVDRAAAGVSTLVQLGLGEPPNSDS